MNETLQTVAVLLAALMWGGVVTLDLIVTPARVMTPDSDPRERNAIGKHIFRWFGIVQVVLGALLVLVILIGGAEMTVLLPALFLLVLAALNAGVLDPAMTALRKPGLSPEERDANQNAVTQLQRAFYATDGFKMILGVILIVVLVTL